MFGLFRNQNKAKLVVKTAKGGGLIRKLQAQVSVGAVLFVMSQLGLQEHIPAELYEPVARFATEGVALLLLAVGYWTSPGENDGVTVEQS